MRALESACVSQLLNNISPTLSLRGGTTRQSTSDRCSAFASEGVAGDWGGVSGRLGGLLRRKLKSLECRE
jgi:hypothetical protein